MSAVIVVFLIWFGLILLLGLTAVVGAHRFRSPAWGHRIGQRFTSAVQASTSATGRIATASVVALAGWSVVIIAGWVLGLTAHRLQGAVDEPAFRWWKSHHIGGSWHDVWWRLTNIGSPRITQGVALAGAIMFAALYFRRRLWWAPSVTILVGYFAERYSQQILKLVVHRGHPPTTLGTWPSGGMGRLVDVFGLFIFFTVLRFWPRSPRSWAAGAALLAMLASVQAYARINNLEHWLTDVVGGLLYGLMLLAMMIAVYVAFTRDPVRDQIPQKSVLVEVD